MATLNVKLNLDTKDLFSDELNFSVADTLSVLGKSVRKTVATSTASASVLGAGEFAFFPWTSTVDLFADAAEGTPVLEIIVFQAAA